MAMTGLVPGMGHGGTARDVTVAAVYLVCLAMLAIVVMYYRPYRGC